MHIPVLKNEVLEYLAPEENENFIDATVGLGGHAKAILERNGPEGKVLGIEWDKELYEILKFQNVKLRNFKRLILVNDSYTNLKRIVQQYNFRVNGILFDLGLSSWHLEKSGRGFSFQKNEPLDMRYSKCYIRTAAEIIASSPKEEIEKILKEYGEERFANRIAKEIVEKRKETAIKTTFQLVEIIKKAVPEKFQHQKIHPATRTFQALRLAVNNELENLKKTLPQALDVLEGQGRLIVISFHSLEDRIVKNFFKESSKKSLLKILTRKPVCPSLAEVQRNPRSRSAKLRAALKLI